ncbi:MAG: hypothetical protein R8K22_03485, partial [Mariprofundaceae bacterium]
MKSASDAVSKKDELIKAHPNDGEAAIIKKEIEPDEDDVPQGAIGRFITQYISGLHTRREWLLLGERVFSHPRYAILIVIALGLSALEQYWFVLAPLALFFTVEWGLRFWLQKEQHWRNRSELVFLALDGIATISMVSVLLMPADMLEYGMYFRFMRLLRGMYLLRM